MSKKTETEVLDNGTIVITEADPPAVDDAVDAELVVEPKPGDPDYDWVARYGTDDLYTHTFSDGTVLALKSFASIYSKTWLYKVRKMASNAEVEFAAFDRASCGEARDVLENLDDTAGDPIDELFKAWTKAGTSRGDGDDGLTPGN